MSKALLPAKPDRLLSQAEAAAYLGVIERTVRNYAARGDLPAYRMRGSRLLRYRQSDLDALLVPVPTVGNSR